MSRVLIHVQYLKGIGHLARAGLIAEAAAGRGLEVHLATGGLPLAGFAPKGVTLHQLQPLQAGPGGFSDLRDEFGEAIDNTWREARQQRTLGLFQEIAPDVLVTESFPFGRRALGFELMPLLEAAEGRAERPAILCSIRDILQQSHKPGRSEETVARLRRHFDAVMVHGDPRFAALEDTFPAAGEIADLVQYTGFVAASIERQAPSPETHAGEVLVSAGGGAVGSALARAALAARPLTALADAPWRIITGPNLPRDNFEKLEAMADERVAVERFRSDFRSLLAQARLSISYAGYNTVCDLMQARVPAVLVSYGGETGEETEQATRAARCEALGLGVSLCDRDLTRVTLADAISPALALPPPAEIAFDLTGAEQAAAIIARHAAAATSGRSA